MKYLDKSSASWIVAGSGKLLVSGRIKQITALTKLMIEKITNETPEPSFP